MVICKTVGVVYSNPYLLNNNAHLQKLKIVDDNVWNLIQVQSVSCVIPLAKTFWTIIIQKAYQVQYLVLLHKAENAALNLFTP